MQHTQSKFKILFNKLESNKARRLSKTPQDLFELAHKLAISGNLLEKNKIYDWIAKHPEASTNDKVRVEINKADWVRRSGDPRKALKKIDKIGMPKENAALLDWLQARAQCTLMLNDFPTTIAIQRKLLTLSKQVHEPNNKTMYRIESLLHSLLLYGQKGGATLNLIYEYQKRIDRVKARATPEYRRSKHIFLWLQARVDLLNKKFTKAANKFLQAWKIKTTVRNRCVAALFWIYTIIKLGLDPKSRNPKIVKYFIDNKGELLETDKYAFTKEYKLASNYLLKKSYD